MKVGFFGYFAATVLRGPLAHWIRWLLEWKKNDEKPNEKNCRSIAVGRGPFGLHRIDMQSRVSDLQSAGHGILWSNCTGRDAVCNRRVRPGGRHGVPPGLSTAFFRYLLPAVRSDDASLESFLGTQ